MLKTIAINQTDKYTTSLTHQLHALRNAASQSAQENTGQSNSYSSQTLNTFITYALKNLQGNLVFNPAFTYGIITDIFIFLLALITYPFWNTSFLNIVRTDSFPKPSIAPKTPPSIPISA